MPREKEHFKLGLTVLIMLGLTVACTVFIGQGAFARRSPAAVHFSADSPLPLLKAGSAIRYGARDVGRISAVNLIERAGPDGPSPITEVLIDLDPSLDLRRDATVFAVGPLLGGPGLIEIRSRGKDPQKASLTAPLTGRVGGLTAEFAKVAGELDADAPDSLLARIKTQLDETREDSIITHLRQTAADLSLAMQRVREQTDPNEREALMAKLRTTVEHVSAIAANVRAQTEAASPDSLTARLVTAVDELNVALGEVSGMLKDNRDNIRSTVAHLNTASETLAMRVLEPIAGELDRNDGMTALAKVHVLFDQLQGILADTGEVAETARQTVVLNKPAISRTIDNLKIMSDHLAQTSKDLKRNPWRLLYRPSLEDTAELNIFDASREFADASGRINDALARMEALLATGGGSISVNDPVFSALRDELKTTFDRLGQARDALWDRLKKE